MLASSDSYSELAEENINRANAGSLEVQDHTALMQAAQVYATLAQAAAVQEQTEMFKAKFETNELWRRL